MNQKSIQIRQDLEKMTSNVKVKLAEEKKKDTELDKQLGFKFKLKEPLDQKFNEQVNSGEFLKNIDRKVEM